jgi:hypothetical protein
MPTKAELQRQLTNVAREASAYQEAFWAIQRGDTPITLTSGEHTIQLLAPGRACGGVVVMDGLVVFADEWISATREADPYRVELSRRVRQLQGEALEAGATTPPSALAPPLRLVHS